MLNYLKRFVGRLSMTTTEAGHGSVFKEIVYDKAKSLLYP
jgi:hypothetical protein